jgi:hypothetical protein
MRDALVLPSGRRSGWPLVAAVAALLALAATLYSAWDTVDLTVYVEAGRRVAAGLSAELRWTLDV